MKPQRSYGTKALSKRKAERALAQLLLNCRVEMLARWTPDAPEWRSIMASHNVLPARANAMLADAQEKRLP